jgi:hypothetical protein
VAADRWEDAVPDRTPEAPCPPHRWEVTSRRRDGGAVEHHRCLRCGAEKDIPFAVATGRRWGRFALPGSRTDRRPS